MLRRVQEAQISFFQVVPNFKKNEKKEGKFEEIAYPENKKTYWTLAQYKHIKKIGSI